MNYFRKLLFICARISFSGIQSRLHLSALLPFLSHTDLDLFTVSAIAPYAVNCLICTDTHIKGLL